MLAESKRLYIGNIPPDITESDLLKEFNAYGVVLQVDLKKKENLVDPGNPNVFAFINICIDENALRTCIDEFSRIKYRGRFLSVSVAKESFLDRLKREREENSQRNKIQPPSEHDQQDAIAKSKQVLPKINARDQSSSGSDSSDSEEEIKAEDKATSSRKLQQQDPQNADENVTFIAKKKASASLLNGKIKIRSTNSDPIHVITKKMKNLKRLDEKGKKSDQQRKESLNKMKNQYNQQKLAIQQALASVDFSKPKKIVFEDEEMVNGADVVPNNNKKKKLFNDDEEEAETNNYEKDFEVKKQFLGKGGEKLMKLQSKFKLDSRFKLDERFLDKDENDEKTEGKAMESKEGDDERSWQLGIIEEIVGRKFETLSEPHKKKLRKTMLRFDPTKEEHQKFLRNVEKVAETFKKPEKNYQPEKQEVEVSKDQFYTVNEDLTESLKRRGDGFSLLSMFGKVEDQTKIKEEDTNKYEEKVIVNNKRDTNALLNPFKFDSSESEDEDDETAKEVPTTKPVENQNKKTTTGIRKESFFIFGDDERLKEGAAFFRRPEQDEPEDYDQVRNRLRLIINKKILKTRKSKEGFKKNKFRLKNKR